jgi:hypothetical protein
MQDATQPPELNEWQLAGRRLVGNLVRFHHWAPGTGILCTKVHENGAVELHGMTGEFAPTLFEIDGETQVIPLLGEVD